jgi:hypothetical protein
MRWFGAFIIGNLLWIGITFVAGVIFANTGFGYRSSWSDFYNFVFYPVGLWLGFKITKTSFLGASTSNKEQEPEDEKKEMVREFYELLDVYTDLPEMDQVGVALSFQVLWKSLIAEFEEPENFGTAKKERQMEFLSKIGDLNTKSARDGEQHMLMASSLFGKSLAPVIAGDFGLAEELAKEVEPINKLGWEWGERAGS